MCQINKELKNKIYVKNYEAIKSLCGIIWKSSKKVKPLIIYLYIYIYIYINF